tara:strand:- start:527 stop:1027 length:501 start_codon:yes stop_codon:yes gene_type:complete
MIRVYVNDKMQQNYSYTLSEKIGNNFNIDFKPELTPYEMLNLGIFGGKYMTDCIDEFPKEWFDHANISSIKNYDLNYFKIKASMPLSHWKEKGWIYHEDPRGWFQWYCRYYMGRRIPNEDIRQIKRWKAMKRHLAQIKKNCIAKDLNCRRRQRQALLHWSYDTRDI